MTLIVDFGRAAAGAFNPTLLSAIEVGLTAGPNTRAQKIHPFTKDSFILKKDFFGKRHSSPLSFPTKIAMSAGTTNLFRECL